MRKTLGGGWCARPGRIPRAADARGRVGCQRLAHRVRRTPDNRRANPKKTARERNDAAGFPFSDDLYQRTLAAKTEFAVAKNATWGKRRRIERRFAIYRVQNGARKRPDDTFRSFSELPPSTSCTTATGRGHVPFSKERKWSDCGGAGYGA